ncbi:hypothetical protein BDZ91DRAFT_740819 [Kalaharituber pfeilii]|nr:hypothetical protein BDZ91DRAFT_740819 [Kalaharituber pfeilii]
MYMAGREVYIRRAERATEVCRLRAEMATEVYMRRAERAATRRGARSGAERFTGVVRER